MHMPCAVGMQVCACVRRCTRVHTRICVPRVGCDERAARGLRALTHSYSLGWPVGSGGPAGDPRPRRAGIGPEAASDGGPALERRLGPGAGLRGCAGLAWEKRRTQGAGPTAGGGLLSGSGGMSAALCLGVNSTPGRSTLCTQLSRGRGGGWLQLAGRHLGVWPRLGGGTLGETGSVHTGGPARAPRQLRGQPRPLKLHPGPLSGLAASPTHVPVDPGATWAGLQTQSPLRTLRLEAALPLHSLERDASPRSRPVPTSTPTLAPSPDTPLSSLKSQSAVPLGARAGVTGSVGPCTSSALPLDAPRGLAWTSSPVTSGSAAALLAAVSRAGARLGWQPPTACPAAPCGPHPCCRQGAQGQGHLGCRAQAGLSQRVPGTEDGLSA